jgi:hypothetical protein
LVLFRLQTLQPPLALNNWWRNVCRKFSADEEVQGTLYPELVTSSTFNKLESQTTLQQQAEVPNTDSFNLI